MEGFLTRWIFALAAALALAFFLDRVQPGRESPMLAGAETGRVRSVALTAQPADASSVEAPSPFDFAVPIDPAQVIDVTFAPAEKGSDDAHRALHIRAARGSVVRSSFDGEVFAVSHLTSAGLAVDVVDPARRRVVRYGHLLRFAPPVREGEKIGKGEILGWVGDTGEPEPGQFVLHVSIHPIPADGAWWRSKPADLGPLISSWRRK